MGSGVTSGSPIHYIGNPTAKGVFITEGPLKGSVAHCLTKDLGKEYSFICLPGVNMGRETRSMLCDMLETLKANGVETIVEAFDMDKYTNEKVGEAAVGLREYISRKGFVVNSAKWGDGSLKGIDDYYLSRWTERQKGVRAVDVQSA